MSSRKSRRTRAKVDYSKIGQIEGISDDELTKPKHTFDSDSEGYQSAEAANVQDDHEEDEDVEMIDPDESEQDEGEPSDDDIIEDKKPRSRKIQGQRFDEELPPIMRASNSTLASIMNKRARGSTADPRRSQRSENMKERLISFYGTSDPELVRAAFWRHKWGNCPFAVVSNALEEPEELRKIKELPVSRSERHTLMKRVTYEKTKLPNLASRISIANVQTEKSAEISQIPLFGAVRNKASQSIIINAGFPVSQAKWAHGHSEKQYLAVATLDGNGGLTSEEHMSNLSVYQRISYTSTLQIYRLGASFEAELYSTITTTFGSPSRIAWRPIPNLTDENNKILGTLACAFHDGNVRVFDVPCNDDLAVHYQLDEPLVEYSLDSKISALCWRTNDVIAVATCDGTIAEFDIVDNSDEYQVPSFLYPLHDTLITDITSAFPNEPHLLYTSSLDGYSRSVDVRDIRRSKSISSRLKGFSVTSAYCYHLRSFVSLEDPMTSRLNPIRRLGLLQAGTSITRHNAGVYSVAASLLHPFVISGGADGSFNIGNAVRRTLLTKRLTNNFYKQANLWVFDLDESQPGHKIYRFTDFNKASELGKHSGNERLIVNPPQVAIMTMDWIPALKWGGMYAAATMSGLIRVENLCIE